MDNHDNNRFDFLRIVAALLVLYSHCYPLFTEGLSDPLANTPFVSFGALGVAMFFVISGHLVTDSLIRSENVFEFLAKRILRIYPGLIAACIFSVFIVGLVFTPFGLWEYISHAQTNLYWLTATGFDIQYNLPLVFAENPKKHTVNGSLWTIKYELICYLTAAAFLTFRRTRRTIALLLLATLVISGLLRHYAAPNSPFDLYLGLDYYHITLGLLFFTGATFSVFKNQLQPSIVLIIAQAAIWFVLPESGRFIIFHTLIASLVLYLGYFGLFLPKINPRIGDLSYGTYLFAFPIQQSLIALGMRELGFWPFVLLSVILTLAIAFVSWHLIEKPMLSLKRKLPGFPAATKPAA